MTLTPDTLAMMEAMINASATYWKENRQALMDQPIPVRAQETLRAANALGWLFVPGNYFWSGIPDGIFEDEEGWL